MESVWGQWILAPRQVQGTQLTTNMCNTRGRLRQSVMLAHTESMKGPRTEVHQPPHMARQAPDALTEAGILHAPRPTPQTWHHQSPGKACMWTCLLYGGGR